MALVLTLAEHAETLLLVILVVLRSLGALGALGGCFGLLRGRRLPHHRLAKPGALKGPGGTELGLLAVWSLLASPREIALLVVGLVLQSSSSFFISKNSNTGSSV